MIGPVWLCVFPSAYQDKHPNAHAQKSLVRTMNCVESWLHIKMFLCVMKFSKAWLWWGNLCLLVPFCGSSLGGARDHYWILWFLWLPYLAICKVALRKIIPFCTHWLVIPQCCLQKAEITWLDNC